MHDPQNHAKYLHDNQENDKNSAQEQRLKCMKLNEAIFFLRDQKDYAENDAHTAYDIAYIAEHGSEIRVETQTRLTARST